MTDQIEVTKVKRINEETTVEWRQPNGRHFSDCALTACPDEPHKEFLDQLATVEATLAARTKFGKKFDGAFTLTGISVTRNGNGRRQFSPSAKVDFGWGEIGVSMPLLLEPDTEKAETADNVLTKGELENIEALFAEGAKYARGERHQATLALEPKDEGSAEPADPFDPDHEEAGEFAGAAAN